jgi:hypothetical protein
MRKLAVAGLLACLLALGLAGAALACSSADSLPVAAEIAPGKAEALVVYRDLRTGRECAVSEHLEAPAVLGRDGKMHIPAGLIGLLEDAVPFRTPESTVRLEIRGRVWEWPEDAVLYVPLRAAMEALGWRVEWTEGKAVLVKS